MNFEGTQVNIPIKGIMRAGTTNVAPDGAMNEVVGMEFKDGSWLPYKEHEEEWTVYLQNIHGTYNVLTGIKDVFTHKTSDDGEHLVFLAGSDNMLAYEIDRDVEYKHIHCRRLISEGVKDVSFVGNMLCAATDKGMDYYLWNETDSEYGKYTMSDTAYPKLSFRVTKGIYNKDSNTTGAEGMHYADYYDAWGSDVIAELDKDKVALNTMVGAMAAARGETRDKGGLTGYFLVCYAFRMKDGSIIHASMPMLMSRPMVKTGDNVTNYDSSLESTNFKVLIDSQEVTLDVNVGDEKSAIISSPFRPTISQGKVDQQFGYIKPKVISGTLEDVNFSSNPKTFYGTENSTLVLINEDSYYVDTDTGRKYYPLKNVASEYNPAPGVPPLSCSIQARQYSAGSEITVQVNAYALSNILQFRIDTGAVSDWKDVQSVCIYMSQEVDPFVSLDTQYVETTMQKNFYCFKRYSGLNFWIRMRSAKLRDNKEIIKEIKDINTLYLVKEIDTEEFNQLVEDNGTNWISVDLEGILGDNLVVREQLPSTAFDLSKLYPEHTRPYNYRLHAYDYATRLFDGHTIDVMAYIKGVGQYAQSVLFTDSYKWEIKVDIKDSKGNKSVVTYSTEQVSTIRNSLSPIISYPSSSADRITIAIYEVGTGDNVYKGVFALSHDSKLNMSYYIDPDLKPIVISLVEEQRPSVIPSFVSTNNTVAYHNGLRVSDVAQPSYFPIQYTYRLGNEKIISLALLTTPVAQDNFGKYQLIVFCTDGIFSLDVDASGNGVYNSQAFVSPEVCVNRNSICEIGGAVFFAGDKGLMVLTGDNNVQMYEPMHNGMPDFLPATTQSKEAHGIYKKMIDSPQILSKTGDTFADSISTTDFVDFIKHEDTHLIYISNKNKLLAYNKNKDYSYFIDIPTHNMTKIAMSAFGDDEDIIGKTIWEAGQSTYTVHTMGYLSEPNSNDIPCLVQSRPIKVQQDDKCSYRVVLTGYFEGILDNYADLIVLGSLDGDHWRVIGVKEKKLIGGFHNIGCLTERGSWKYLMFIFGGKLTNASHIDSVDITVDGRYNNKKR